MHKCRWDILIDFIKENKFRSIAEIGIDYGNTAINILNSCGKDLDIYYLVDFVKRGVVADFIINTPAIFLEMTSEKASKLIPDNFLDLVFIDAAHDYKSVAEDIRLWVPKVKVGGIVSGHDYHKVYPGVIQAVNESFPKVNLERDYEKSEAENLLWWIRKEK